MKNKRSSGCKNLSCLIISICFLLLPFLSYADVPFSDTLTKHNLFSGGGHTWHVLNFKEEGCSTADLTCQLKYIDTIAFGSESLKGKREEHISPDRYLKYEAVKTLLQKNGKIFSNIEKLSNSYEKIVRDMDAIYDKAQNVYAIHIPSKRVREIKAKILLKVRKSYEALRTHSLRLYDQGTRVENVLSKLYEPVLEAYSLSALSEGMAKNFADEFSLAKITLDEQGIEQALEQTEQEMQKILKESEIIFRDALSNLENLDTQ